VKDARAEKVADILTEYSVPVSKGQLVSIQGNVEGEPLMLAIYERVLARGANAILRPTFEHAEPILYRAVSAEQLDFVWPTDHWFMEHLDARFVVIADTNTKQLTNVDPAKQARVAQARKPVFDTFMRRQAAKELLWCVTMFPTEANAIDAAMSRDEYEDFFYGACLVDKPDPIAEWKALAERHQSIIDWLRGRRDVHIEGDGTDLHLAVDDRVWEPANGDANFPDGELFTAPVEDRTRGMVSFSYPAFANGKAVEGIQLEFKDGRVSRASARSNEDFLHRMLDTDAGARILGELGIGTNYGIKEFTGSTLLDEKMGGTVHLAVGAAYPETGGSNESAIHWDMVCDLRRGGRITVDGEPLMEDGQLLV
jgi:aminopeptidase